MKKSFMGAVILGAMSMAGMSSAALASQSMPIVQVPAKAATPGTRGLFNDVVLPVTSNPWAYGRKGARISMAQQKRASAKKRNVARHRKAGRK